MSDPNRGAVIFHDIQQNRNCPLIIKMIYQFRREKDIFQRISEIKCILDDTLEVSELRLKRERGCEKHYPLILQLFKGFSRQLFHLLWHLGCVSLQTFWGLTKFCKNYRNPFDQQNVIPLGLLCLTNCSKQWCFFEK